MPMVSLTHTKELSGINGHCPLYQATCESERLLSVPIHFCPLLQVGARCRGGVLCAGEVPYLGHLSLHTGGLEGRHRLLRCCRAVKVHKAIPYRGREREGKDRHLLNH